MKRNWLQCLHTVPLYKFTNWNPWIQGVSVFTKSTQNALNPTIHFAWYGPISITQPIKIPFTLRMNHIYPTSMKIKESTKVGFPLSQIWPFYTPIWSPFHNAWAPHGVPHLHSSSPIKTSPTDALTSNQNWRRLCMTWGLLAAVAFMGVSYHSKS